MTKLIEGIKRLFRPVDMTEGKVSRVFGRFLIPILIANFINESYVMFDTIIPGQFISATGVAGINIGTKFTYFFVGLLTGATAGFSVIPARFFGAKDNRNVRRSYLTTLLMILAVGVGSAVLCIGFGWLFLRLMGLHSSTTDLVMQEEYVAAQTWIYIVGASLIVQAFGLGLLAFLRAIGDNTASFLFASFAAILSMAFEAILVIWLKMGVTGVSLAILLAYTVMTIIYLLYIRYKHPELRTHRSDWTMQGHDMAQFAKMGLPLGFQYSLCQLGVIAVNYRLVNLDTNAMGEMIAGAPAQLGYGLVNKLLAIINNFYGAIGMGCVAFAGQNWGAKRTDRIKRGIGYAAIVSYIGWFVIGATILLLSINGTYQKIFYAESSITDASIKFGNLYMYIIIPCAATTQWIFICRTTLQGMQKPLYPFVGGMLELVARFIFSLGIPLIITKGLPATAEMADSIYPWIAVADMAAWCFANAWLIPNLIRFLKVKENNETAI